MMIARSTSRPMPLRQLMTYSEKCARDLIEHCRSFLGPRLDEFRDLSRPVRRRSTYPKMISVHNALKNLVAAGDEACERAEHLHERLEEIRQHALKEQARRTFGRT